MGVKEERLVRGDEALRDSLRDPEFRREYRLLQPLFDVVGQIIALRHKRKLSQTELADRVGTKQPHISELESADVDFRFSTLVHLADALGADVKVTISPREEAAQTVAAYMTYDFSKQLQDAGTIGRWRLITTHGQRGHHFADVVSDLMAKANFTSPKAPYGGDPFGTVNLVEDREEEAPVVVGAYR